MTYDRRMTDKALAREAARYARERHETDVEHRMTLSPVTLRAKATGDSGQTFEGYAIRYNSPTWIGYWDDDPWGFWEEVSAGAADASLRSDDIVCLYNHDLNYMLGRTSSGTLRLSSDKDGLLTVNDLPDTTVGRDLGVLVARQDVAGMSFSFIPTQGGEHWTVGADGKDHRQLTGINIFDVAPCVLPAYSDTTASVRAVSLGRRASPRPYDEKRAAQSEQLSEQQSDNNDNGNKDHGDEDDPKLRSEGLPAVDEPEDWREINERYERSLDLERTRWYL